MESLPDDFGDVGELTHKLVSHRNDKGRFEGFIQVAGGASRLGWKVEVSGEYVNSWDLQTEALHTFSRFKAGEVKALTNEQSRKFRGYRLTGRVRYVVAEDGWEPVLEMKKLEEPYRGRKVVYQGGETPFPRNAQRTPERATLFAIEYGERLVMGLVGNLHAFADPAKPEGSSV